MFHLSPRLTTSRSSRFRHSRARVAKAGLAAAVLCLGLAACGDDTATSDGADRSCLSDPGLTPIDTAAAQRADVDGTSLTLITHDSFTVSDGLFDAFRDETGIDVTVLTAGDAGQVVSQSVLTAGDPVGDVLFGIDNTLLCRGLNADLFTPYAADGLASVPDEWELDPYHRVTPIDVGDVCLNYSLQAFDDSPPESLADLATPAFKDTFVTENPETSSPGMAFLLATVATFGEDGFEQYWRDLRANGLEVTSGWSEAYEESFGSGAGPRSVVTSYASSPAADVLYSDPARDEPAIGVVESSCFRQIEFAGVLAGTKHPEAAARLVEFMLSPTFQADIPLNMFVFPANDTVALPEVFDNTVSLVDDALTLDPVEIESNRADWTDKWTNAVLR